MPKTGNSMETRGERKGLTAAGLLLGVMETIQNSTCGDDYIAFDKTKNHLIEHFKWVNFVIW
jgi:hypothetical protein